MEIYGYARVSTREQNEDRQMVALQAFGIPPGNIYLDKLSGKDFHRPQYRQLLYRLHAGDALVILSIDRLGRNYAEILEQWRLITKKKGADVIVLDMPLLDTSKKDRDLTGTLIADIVLQLLSYVAQTEREAIRKRQEEGIAAARIRGVQFGRPRKPVPAEFERIYVRWRRGEFSAREAARRLGVAAQTFANWCAEAKKNGPKRP